MQEIASKKDDYALQPWQRASWWYRAAPLTERIALKQKNTDSYSPHTSVNSDKAKQRLQRWKEQSPFNKGDYFARRLSMDSLTEDDLLALLDEPMEATPADNAPSPTWFIELLTAFTGQDAPTDFTQLPSAAGQNTQGIAFLNSLGPLLRMKLASLRAGIQELTQQYTSLPFDPQTIVSLLFAYIPAIIFPGLSKTIVLEMHVARVQGHLQGETPRRTLSVLLTAAWSTGEDAVSPGGIRRPGPSTCRGA